MGSELLAELFKGYGDVIGREELTEILMELDGAKWHSCVCVFPSHVSHTSCRHLLFG